MSFSYYGFVEFDLKREAIEINLCDPTPKELPTGQRYPTKIQHVRSLDGMKERARLPSTPRRSP
jgi:hypothetical protein